MPILIRSALLRDAPALRDVTDPAAPAAARARRATGDDHDKLPVGVVPTPFERARQPATNPPPGVAASTPNRSTTAATNQARHDEQPTGRGRTAAAPDGHPHDHTGRWLQAERLPDHFERLFRAAYALCGSREDAEDLVQETYAHVLRRPRWLRAGGELAYLMRVLRNIWYDTSSRARRDATSTGTVQDAEFALDPRADADMLLQARAAYAAIAGLSAPLRETIVAVDVLGLSYKQAARALRTREGTIMSRLYRARRTVAEAMREDPP